MLIVYRSAIEAYISSTALQMKCLLNITKRLLKLKTTLHSWQIYWKC